MLLSLIARSVAQSSMDVSMREKMKQKFDIHVAYLLAKEKRVFTKMAPICQIEERHGVDLGAGYI